MTGRWAQVKDIFSEAIERTGEARERYVVDACGGDAELLAQVRVLLNADDHSDTLLDGDARRALGGPAEPAGPDDGGGAIDAYRLIRRIGEGGMGDVWLAQQGAPVKRDVALKIIKPGMDSRRVVARFAAERQALAVMDHPAIAKVFDAGTTAQGRPYFVMEFVQGVPITRHCTAQRLSIAERLRLVIRVCEGVQHAHQKGIIHRDLKPSNVLVTTQDGKTVPKIIDFGIAKATDQRRREGTVFTELGVLMGTPEYMSPEQADLAADDVDTRSDVYSLGVMLYELLTDALPFDPGELRTLGFDELRRRIREEDPERPSLRVLAGDRGPVSGAAAEARDTESAAWRRQLKGDLDWIVLRAMEKDRARRYGSPTELAADIRRHLACQPVLAGPPGLRYKAGKFVRRNFLGVATTALLGLVLVGFATTMAVQTRRIARSAVDLRQLAEFQAEQLSGIDLEAMGVRLRRSLLDRGSDALARSGRSAEEAAALLEGVDRVFAATNFADIARDVLDSNIFGPALDTIDRQFADQPRVRADLLQSVATTMVGFGLYERAEASQSEALRIRREVLGDADPDTLDSSYGMATILFEKGERERGVAEIREALETARRTLGPDHPATLDLAWKAVGYVAQLDPQAGLRIAQDARERSLRVLPEDDAIAIKIQFTLASVYSAVGRLDEAEQTTKAALQAFERAVGASNPRELINYRAGLATLLWLRGKLGEAEALMRDNLSLARAVLGDEHPKTLAAMTDLATLFETRGELDRAEPLLLTAWETAQRVQGPNNPGTLLALHNLAFVRYRQGRLDRAAQAMEQALIGRRENLAAGHPGIIGNMGNLAMVWAAQGHGADAERLARQALDLGIEQLGPDHWLVANTRGQLGLALAAQGRHDEARREMHAARDSLAASLGQDNERTQRIVGYLADLPPQ